MMYDVPQTDAVTEAAMAAMVARLRASCPKPEALEGIGDGPIALALAEWIGRATSALGDRVTGPILRWDGALDGPVRKLATRDIYNLRGRKRDAGNDTTIDSVADEALAYLARLAPPNKTENPTIICGDGTPLDAPHVASSRCADAWVDIRAGRTVRA